MGISGFIIKGTSLGSARFYLIGIFVSEILLNLREVLQLIDKEFYLSYFCDINVSERTLSFFSTVHDVCPTFLYFIAMCGRLYLTLYLAKFLGLLFLRASSSS